MPTRTQIAALPRCATGWGMGEDWKELRDDSGRYLGRLNVRTLTLVLVVRGGQKVIELREVILPEMPPRQTGQPVLQFS